MKKYLVIIIILVIALFATNPSIDAFYQKALREELNMGNEWFAQAKYALVDAKFEYKNYYLCGLMKSRASDKISYIGIFNQVIAMPSDDLGLFEDK